MVRGGNNYSNDKNPQKSRVVVPSGVRVPPQSIDAEKSVLGAMLLDKDAIIKIIDILTAEDFYEERHGLIYEAMLNLFEKRRPIDIVTLSEILESADQIKAVGGSAYLADLVNETPSAANIVHYAQICREKAVLRRLIAAAGGITELGYDEDAELAETLDKAEQSLFAVSQKFLKNKFIAISTVLTEAFDRIDKIHKDKDKGAIRGVPSGYKDLDTITAGFQNSDLIILAARPSMGKTSFALNLAEHAAIEEKIPVGIFSLEMSKDQLIDRLLSSQSGVDSWKLRTGNLSDEDFPKIGYAMGVLSEAPIFIDDSAGANVMEVRAKARRLQMEHGLGLIVIDYLQLMEGRARSNEANRVQEISEISRSLKGLARELNVPVIALSQLSRAVEHRDNKRPQLSDLRESGCLSGDTLVYDAKTGKRKQIKDLVNEQNFYCLSLNIELKLKEEKATRIFSTGIKPVNKMLLSSGKEIKATGNHKFLTVEGWKRLDQLKPDEFIATPRIISSSNQIKLSPDKIIVLAHLIGDGCYLARQPLHYTNADPLCIEVVNKASKNAFATKNRIVNQKTWQHLYLSSPYHLTHGKRNPIVKWLDEELDIYDQRSGQKEIPKVIFSLSKSQLALFISHLFATDGGLTKSAGLWRLHYASKSKKLISGLQHLLLKFEIHSTIKINKKKGYDPVYDLVISGKNDQVKFCKQIGIFGAKSKNVIIALLELEKIKANTNIDIIPKEVWLKIKKRFSAIGLTSRTFHTKMDWAYSGTQRYGSGLSRERLRSVAVRLDNKELEQLAGSDIFWEKIKTIEPCGKEEVFDITMPENHNFVANDIIVHNSIEQDADVVMFMYRDEYYNPESEKKGITEILIKKHRNGPTGMMELFFNPAQMRFSNLEKHRTDGQEIRDAE